MIPARAESWFAARRGPGRAALAAALGAGLALGHAPFDFPWLWIVAFPLLLVLLSVAPRPWLTAWWAGLGYFGLSLHWIVEPFLIDVARHGWLAPFALVGLCGGLAVFWGLAGALAGRAAARGVPVPAGFPLALSLTEFARAHVLTGFPWALPAYVWVETPMAQVAAWVGPHGLGLLAMLGLAALAARRRWVMALGVAGLAALFAGGALRAPSLAKGDPAAPVVRLVQPNAAQRLKWQPGMAQVFYERLIEMTEAPSDVPLALIVWPETAVPFLLDDRPDLQADIAAAAGGAPVALGIRRYADGWYNGLAVLDADGAVLASYDKWHLVPFGEYVPLRGLATSLGLGDFIDGLVGSFEAGPGQAVIALGTAPAFQPLICYEAIFPHQVGGAGRPAFLLQITNDAWFGRFSGPYQHLAQARMRAIEQGLPLLRAANTGVSAVIDARGRVLDRIPLGTAGFVDASLPQPMGWTPYSRHGDRLYFGLLALAVLAAVALRRA